MEHGFNYIFQSVPDSDSHEIYIYDDISEHGEWNWNTWTYDESETSAKHFRDLLSEIPDGDPITVYINSHGGDVYQAAAIASMLRRRSGRVTTVVDGASHSAAFTILQAGTWRVMNRGTSAIIHNMWTYAAGNAKQLREIADQLDIAMEGEIAYYLERAKISREKLVELLDAETTLTPEKALEYGFIDEIAEPRNRLQADTESPAEAPKQAVQKLADPVMEKLSHIESMITEMRLQPPVITSEEILEVRPGKPEPAPVEQPELNMDEKGAGFNALFSR